jgi:hypothetical protein
MPDKKKIPPPRKGGSGKSRQTESDDEVKDSGGDPAEAFCTTCNVWYSLKAGGHDH